MRPPLTSRTIVKSALSLDFVRVKIRIADKSDEFVDPTNYGVEMAFPLAAKDPVAGDWLAAEWTTGESDGPPYHARVTVGPGGDIEPSVGRYGIWVRVNALDEIPTRLVGRLEVI